MLLPPLSSDLAPVEFSPLIASARAQKEIDKRLIDKAVTLRIVQELPAVLDNAMNLALNAESESTRLDATKYLLDRAAGKPVERSQSTNVNLNLLVPADEVSQRLTHLLENSFYAKD